MNIRDFFMKGAAVNNSILKTRSNAVIFATKTSDFFCIFAM